MRPGRQARHHAAVGGMQHVLGTGELAQNLATGGNHCGSSVIARRLDAKHQRVTVQPRNDLLL